MIKAGYCTDCGVEVFRFVTHPITEQRIPLWPAPDSRYVIVRNAEKDTMTPGIAYCAACCPDPYTDVLASDSPAIHGQCVVGIEDAFERHARWFTDRYGAWLRAWLTDELRMDPDALVKLWEDDRRLANG